MKKLVSIAVCVVLKISAQQTIAYTQYTFNKAGMNPAASGTEIDRKYYAVAGIRRQWIGFENSPRQNFVNVGYTLRPERSYRYWQNFSLYIDNEDAGLLGNSSAYLGYTMHFLLRKKYVLSFGAYAGARLFQRNTGGFDVNDPAIKNSCSSIVTYPDIIPGVRFNSSKEFAGLSVRQITVTRQRDHSGNTIGSGSKLLPTIYAEYGRKIQISDRLLAMPSLAVNMPVLSIPMVDFSLMYYYMNRFGAGFSLRNVNFASAIVQIRFLQNFSAGFAYSYPLNATRLGSPNTIELMIGVVPFGMYEKLTGKHSVARCPTLSY